MPLARSLERLDFQEPHAARAPGLVRVDSAGDADGASEGAIIREVEAAFGAEIDFVYFRRFADGRASQALALVIDNSDERITPLVLAGLHRRLWWSGIAPLLYVGWPTRVDVLAAGRGPDFWVAGRDEYRPWDQFDIVREVSSALGGIHRLSALRLADGTFWDDPDNAGVVSHKDSAAGELVRAIVEIDAVLNGDSNEDLRRLLLFTILIKYLDDRRVFPDHWFSDFVAGATSFHDVLANGDPHVLGRLFSALRNRFNGDVFAGAETVARLTSLQIRKLAVLVEGKTDGTQGLLWARYSFEHLPVEVMSNVYERFVGGSTAVYTPPFLASFMLDRVLPWEGIDGTETVLDPACGSGVFLVGAFKRLIVAWRARNGWRRPDVATLKEILRRSIFGVELDPFAAELTVFSLCLALCDALRPDVIWRELRFDQLGGENITTGDFFSVDCPRLVDVVVGNPPFESKLSAAAEAYDVKARRSRVRLPDNQIAYLFLEHALQNLTTRGRICLLQPHGLIYNRKVEQFRAHILNTHTIEEVLDFVSIRGLYDGADVKTVAIVGRAGPPVENTATVHVLLRRTIAASERVAFEIDHYDSHRALQHTIMEGWWRANLLGGGRLAAVASRFEGMQSLAQFVAKQGTWTYGEGFIDADGGQVATYLTGLRFLPTSALSENGIDTSALGVVEQKTFHRPRTESLYTAPLIVIKEHETLPMAFVRDGRLAFRDQIVGISAPTTDLSYLEEVYNRLSARRRQYRFLCTIRGSKALLSKATAILKSDVDHLPFPDRDDEMNLASWEKILQDDVLDHMTDYVRLGQASEVMSRAASGEDVVAYAETFTHMLGTVYPNLVDDGHVKLGGIICQSFRFGQGAPTPTSSTAFGSLREVLNAQDGSRLSTVRILRYYDHNRLMLVKPDRLRYWLRSTAIRDADETLIELVAQGY
jgi:hypothetical protein